MPKCGTLTNEQTVRRTNKLPLIIHYNVDITLFYLGENIDFGDGHSFHVDSELLSEPQFAILVFFRQKKH